MMQSEAFGFIIFYHYILLSPCEPLIGRVVKNAEGVHGRSGDLNICHLHLFTKSFETVPLKSPFFAMQDGVHGRGGDLRICHLHIFTNLLTQSL
jgi:hypothetical protein